MHSQIFSLLFGIGCEDGALKRTGETALREVLATNEGAWLHMLSEDATVTFEVWEKNKKEYPPLSPLGGGTDPRVLR